MSFSMVEKQECCICYVKTRECLQCSKEHAVCFRCLQNILTICNCDECVGLNWRCPLCRTDCSLTAQQILAIGFGSSKILNKIRD